jgi:hypothetical protein
VGHPDEKMIIIILTSFVITTMSMSGWERIFELTDMIRSLKKCTTALALPLALSIVLNVLEIELKAVWDAQCKECEEIEQQEKEMMEAIEAYLKLDLGNDGDLDDDDYGRGPLIINDVVMEW